MVSKLGLGRMKALLALAAGSLVSAQCSEPLLAITDAQEYEAGNGWYSFGLQPSGAKVTHTFTLKNLSSSEAQIYSIYGWAPFSVEPGSCLNQATSPPRLAANGGTCTFGVTFSPTAPGHARGSVVIYYSSRTLTLNLIGTAAAASTGLSISDNGNDFYAPDRAWPAYDFGPKALGRSLSKTFTVANRGTSAIGLGNDPQFGLRAPFSIMGGTCKSGTALA